MVILKSVVSAFECAMNRIERPNFCVMTVVSYDELGVFRFFPLFLIVFLKIDGGHNFEQVFGNCADTTTTNINSSGPEAVISSMQ